MTKLDSFKVNWLIESLQKKILLLSLITVNIAFTLKHGFHIIYLNRRFCRYHVFSLLGINSLASEKEPSI